MTFRQVRHQCPGCGAAIALDRALARCAGCRGVWISEAGLVERVQIMRGVLAPPVEPDFAPSLHRAGDRRCPVCREPLKPVALGAIELERCDRKHGLWFDDTELQAVLEAAAPIEGDDRLGAVDVAEGTGYILAAIAGLFGS